MGGCDRRTKCGTKELPHVRGQGQKQGGPHARRAVAKRNYPRPRSGAAVENARLRWFRNGERSYSSSEARGSGREETPASEELWLRGHRRA